MQARPMFLETDAINRQGYFDPRYTCDLDNSSPELRWNLTPSGAKGFAVIAEDLDTPDKPLTHWLIYHIPASVHHLPAGIPPQETLPNGIRQGVNSFGKLGYSGPCPPPGDRPHRYLFKLYALSELPQLPHRIKKEEFLTSVEGLILVTSEVLGQYQRFIQRAG
jgi:Raf kinase inhibitor-like YbhB/YbcL family protein